jgi:hypothetical protein
LHISIISSLLGRSISVCDPLSHTFLELSK